MKIGITYHITLFSLEGEYTLNELNLIGSFLLHKHLVFHKLQYSWEG